MPSPEFAGVLQLLASMPEPEAGITFEERRAGFEEHTSVLAPAADVSVEPTRVGDMAAEWIFTPNAHEDRVVLYFHGGGYAIGSLNTHREMVSHIARAARARVLLVDYRLAPEHPFPAAVEDAKAAYRHLLDRGAAPGRMVLAGDSAGGGLTVAALVALRDQGVSLPAAGICLSPWVDLAGEGDSMTGKAEADPTVGYDDLQVFVRAYLGDRDPKTPLASQLYADLSGLPPLLIQVGTSEVLLDDSTRLAKRAEQAGVEATLETWEEMVHVWHFFASMLPEGREAVERIGRFVIDRTGE
ncbi:MAG: alpha/beta hydrolase [Proteobacteria bacterium]|nr:alpha/beta hydrolase [Pseudomonadota bacterium]